ncbi:Hypothetical predicted protein [Marmota monax]|uniref:Uncharacterized protein n=1 Tax=Marmota monax TaxID=9995 RepID=A0A5E4B075_MARMO|nr:Hypothetical predicted protein [Marmota monax]
MRGLPSLRTTRRPLTRGLRCGAEPLTLFLRGTLRQRDHEPVPSNLLLSPSPRWRREVTTRGGTPYGLLAYGDLRKGRRWGVSAAVHDGAVLPGAGLDSRPKRGTDKSRIPEKVLAPWELTKRGGVQGIQNKKGSRHCRDRSEKKI